MDSTTLFTTFLGRLGESAVDDGKGSVLEERGGGESHLLWQQLDCRDGRILDVGGAGRKAVISRRVRRKCLVSFK